MRPPGPTALHRFPFALLTLLATVGCEEDSQVIQGAAELRVDRAAIDFGRVFVGLRPIRAFTISNLGNVPLTFTVRLAGDAEGYAVGPPGGAVPPGTELTLQILFQPRRSGERLAAVLIDTNATGTGTASVSLRGIGVDIPDCEDGNGCTEDTFDIETGRCNHVAVPVPCDDFNACTTNDTCVEGICLGESLRCDDGNECTDDACDSVAGCVFLPTGRCDDGNDCTLDICTIGGCEHEPLPDFTSCEDDQEQCTIDDFCQGGECVQSARPQPDGTECELEDPCGDAECQDQVCVYVNYTPPAIGEIAFTATVAAFAPGTLENPIVDRNDTAFIGVTGGVMAVDECGERAWLNEDIGTPTFNAAAGLPGILTVPVGSRFFDLDTQSGEVLRSLDLADVVAPIDPVAPVGTASTATVTTQILDLTVRASGALVASVIRTVETATLTDTQGFLVEVNAPHTIATRFADLGSRYATRLGLDIEESVVAILRDVADGPPNGAQSGTERVVRLGIDGVPGGTWSSSEVNARRTDFAIGQNGEVLWAAGLLSIDRRGAPVPLLPPPSDPDQLRAGAPIVFGDTVYVIEKREGLPQPDTFYLLAMTATASMALQFEVELPGPTIQHSPVVDLAGRVYLITAQADLLIIDPDGTIALEVPVPMVATPIEGVALTLTSRGNLLMSTGDRLIAIKGVAGLANSSWPRHRRDNLATGHR